MAIKAFASFNPVFSFLWLLFSLSYRTGESKWFLNAEKITKDVMFIGQIPANT